jgi:general L-amino acid transport system permease protein
MLSAPRRGRGPARWIKTNLFGTVPDGVVTVALLGSLLWALQAFFDWAVVHAVGFTGSEQECRAREGACWAAVGNNIGLFLFGTYPAADRWRPATALALIVLSFAAAFVPALRRWSILLPLYASSVVFVATLLLGGGWSGLSAVDPDIIGGITLTFFICWIALPLALPAALVLALARQSTYAAIRLAATGYIEIVRGLPLIVVLFMAAVLFPLFVAGGASTAKVFRAMLGIGLFAAAYLAEVLRGGLQAIPREQITAAQSLGLRYWQIQFHIVLPQVFPIVVRPLSGMYINFFKNTSLVSVIGLFELTGITTIVITKPEWAPFSEETYLLVAFVYVLCCWAMSRLATNIEKQISTFREK